MTDLARLFASWILVVFSIRFLFDALRTPASKFSGAAWIFVVLAGALLYLGLSLAGD